MNRIMLFFTAAMACLFGAGYSYQIDNWFAFAGWTAATLFSLIITILFIINSNYRNYDNN